MKHNAKKVRKMYGNEVIVGFAGATADAFTLFGRLEEKLEEFNNNLLRELYNSYLISKFKQYTIQLYESQNKLLG